MIISSRYRFAFEGTSVYHCTVEGVSKKGDAKKIPEISTVFDVRFEVRYSDSVFLSICERNQDGVVITRKHCGIGSGKNSSGLSSLNSSLSMISPPGSVYRRLNL